MIPEAIVDQLRDRDREVAALAAEVARLRMALAAAGVCTYSSDAVAIVELALGQ